MVVATVDQIKDVGILMRSRSRTQSRFSDVISTLVLRSVSVSCYLLHPLVVLQTERVYKTSGNSPSLRTELLIEHINLATNRAHEGHGYKTNINLDPVQDGRRACICDNYALGCTDRCAEYTHSISGQAGLRQTPRGRLGLWLVMCHW